MKVNTDIESVNEWRENKVRQVLMAWRLTTSLCLMVQSWKHTHTHTHRGISVVCVLYLFSAHECVCARVCLIDWNMAETVHRGTFTRDTKRGTCWQSLAEEKVTGWLDKLCYLTSEREKHQQPKCSLELTVTALFSLNCWQSFCFTWEYFFYVSSFIHVNMKAFFLVTISPSTQRDPHPTVSLH